MPVIQCPIPDGNYATNDVDPAIAAVLLTVHNNVHVTRSASAGVVSTKQRAPKLSRPVINKGSSEEIWNTFIARWDMFKRATELSNAEICQQLFQCCDENLGDDILKCHPTAINASE